MFDFLTYIPFFGNFLATVIPFVLVLSVVVFIHEYGHYIVGRWCGIHAEVFSLGFGPVVKRWTDKRGTVWQIAALPLGGYVKFLGDADGASSRADPERLNDVPEHLRGKSFHGAAIYKRMLTVLAGPVANFILSIVVFAGLVMATGVANQTPIIGKLHPYLERETTLRSGDKIVAIEGQTIETFGDVFSVDAGDASTLTYTIERDAQRLDVSGPIPMPAIAGGIEPLSPASNAGLEPGDVVIRANGTDIGSFTQLRDIIGAEPVEGQGIAIDVWRDGNVIPLTLNPKIRDYESSEGVFEKRMMIGVYAGLAFEPEVSTPTPWQALHLGVSQTWRVITMSLTGIYHIVTGSLGVENLQGPLGIAQVSGETASQGILSFVRLIAIISTAIGLMNLFPIPILDGGHLLIFSYEAIRGRPPHERVLNALMGAGMFFVLFLMIFATYNDFTRL